VKKYKLLLTGSFDNIYMVDYVKFLKKENPNALIYYWGNKSEFLAGEDEECLGLLEEYYTFNFLRGITRIPFLKQLYIKNALRHYFRKFCKSKSFDVVCIQSAKDYNAYLTDLYKKCSSKILLVPWGAEIYRATPKRIVLQKQVFNIANNVAGIKTRFSDEIKAKYDVPENKFVPLTMGSALIDYIIENKDTIKTEYAKNKLNVEGKYVITCGHNATPGQNHLAMIEAIRKVKNKIQDEIVLFFLFTYSCNSDYVEMVKNRVKEYSLNAVFFEEFLDIPTLFLLRQASDMFIHIQCTDAGSTSVREYLLLGKKVINGEWLRYPELEVNGQIPYSVVENIDSLSDVIIDAYKSKPILINDGIAENIEQRGWKKAIKKWNDYFESVS